MIWHKYVTGRKESTILHLPDQEDMYKNKHLKNKNKSNKKVESREIVDNISAYSAACRLKHASLMLS